MSPQLSRDMAVLTLCGDGRSGALGLVVVSGLFTLAGLGLLLFSPGDRVLGALVVTFFGGCLLVGISRRGDGPPETSRLLAAGALLMGVGCGVAAWALLAGELTSSRVPEPALVVLAMLGVVLFGAGGALLLARSLRGGSSPTA